MAQHYTKWMVFFDYNSKTHGLKPRVGRFRDAARKHPGDVEYFGGPENYMTAAEARALCDRLNATD